MYGTGQLLCTFPYQLRVNMHVWMHVRGPETILIAVDTCESG
jgi:hypothetical protein